MDHFDPKRFSTLPTDTVDPTWKKKQREQITIKEIHDSYDNSNTDILAWAKKVLAECETDDIAKGERLAKLGFFNSEKAKASAKKIEEKKAAQALAELVEHYRVHYPFQKFITREQVRDINKKYSLVCVTADCYKCDIPEKNLAEIERFVIKEEDKVFVANVANWKHKAQYNFLTKEEAHKSYHSGVTEEPFYISCPQKDAIIREGFSVREDGFVLKDEIPDPIVMKPVVGGFLIVTKWGLDAQDESLVNETLN